MRSLELFQGFNAASVVNAGDLKLLSLGGGRTGEFVNGLDRVLKLGRVPYHHIDLVLKVNVLFVERSKLLTVLGIVGGTFLGKMAEGLDELSNLDLFILNILDLFLEL